MARHPLRDCWASELPVVLLLLLLRPPQTPGRERRAPLGRREEARAPQRGCAELATYSGRESVG